MLRQNNQNQLRERPRGVSITSVVMNGAAAAFFMCGTVLILTARFKPDSDDTTKVLEYSTGATLIISGLILGALNARYLSAENYQQLTRTEDTSNALIHLMPVVSGNSGVLLIELAALSSHSDSTHKALAYFTGVALIVNATFAARYTCHHRQNYGDRPMFQPIIPADQAARQEPNDNNSTEASATGPSAA